MSEGSSMGFGAFLMGVGLIIMAGIFAMGQESGEYWMRENYRKCIAAAGELRRTYCIDYVIFDKPYDGEKQ